MLRSRKIRLAVFSAAGLLAFIGLILGALDSPAAKQFALRQAVRALRDQGIAFQSSRLDYNLFHSRVDLRDVRIQSLQTPDLPPLGLADRVTAELDLRRIFAGQYYLRDAVLDNLRVHLVIAPDGRDNIPRPPQMTASSQPIDYLVQHLKISGGEFQYDDRRQSLAAAFPVDTVEITGQAVTRAHHLVLRTRDGGSLTRAGRSLRLSSVSADLNIADPRLDLRAQTALSLASLPEFAGIPRKARGHVNLTLTAGGTLAALTTTVRLRGDNLAVEPFDQITLDANASYDAAASRLRLDSADFTAPWARLRARADLDLSPAARESTAQFTIRDLDLTRASSLLHSPVRIASTAAVEGQAHWPGLRFEAAAGDAFVHLASRPSPAVDTLPVDAAVRATIDSNRITATLDELRAAGASLTGQVSLLNRKSLAGELHAAAPQISAALAAAERYLGKPPGSLAGTPVEGSLTATAQLAGTLDAPAAALSLAVPDLAAGGLRDIALDASANYSPASLSIDRAAVRWQNQSLTAQGSIGLRSPQPLQLAAQSAGISLPAVLSALNHGDLPIAGTVDLNAQVNGTLDSPQAALTVSGHELSAWSQPLGTLTAGARFQNRRLDLGDLRLSGDAFQASGQYDLATQHYQLQAHARDFQLSALTLSDGTPVRGVLQIDAAGQGTLDDPSGDLRLIADRVQFGEQEFGRFEATVQSANWQAEVAASAPRFNLTASAQTGLRDPYPATLQLHFAKSDLAQLSLKLDPPLRGSFSAIVNASGDLKNYQKGAVRAEVSELDLQWNGEPIHAEGPFVTRYSQGVVNLDRAAFTAAGSRVEVSGALPLEPTAPPGALVLDTQLDLPGIGRLVPNANLDLQGTASITGEIRGTLQRLDPALAISVASPRIAPPGLSPAITNASLKGQVRDGALEIENASASWGDASVTASGAIPFALLPPDLPVDLPRRTGPARFTADLKGLNLASLQGVPKAIAGMASAHFEAETPRPDLDAVKATLTFPDLHATLGTYSIAQDGASEVVLANGLVEVRRLRLTGPATEIALSGTAQVAGPQALDLRLDGKLDASVAAAFTDTLRARGATEVHATLGGSLNQPQAKGYVQIADGQFSMPDPRIGIEGLNLRVNLEGDRAAIAHLEGQVNGGAFTGQGSIAIADGSLKESDLSLRAQDLYLDFPAGLKTVSDIQLQLETRENHLAVGGSILIKEGGFTDDLNFDRGILASAIAPPTLDLTEQRNPLLDSIRFHVRLNTQDPIAIENNLGKAAISAQLVLLGSPYEPGLSGRLVIEEGSELTLQERRYLVSRGIVTFTSERRIEPNLDIEATTTVSIYDIALHISGTPADTKTQLTSNPVLPEPDILAILVTGKTLDEVRGQEFQVAQAQVLSYLTGRVGSTLGRQVENATGLSRVRIEPNLIAAEINPGARLTVGQDVTPQLQLVYSMNLVDSTDQIYQVEYDLSKRFSTRGTRQSDGSFRFDFHHDLRFGGTSTRQRSAVPETRRIGLVTLSGNSWFPESQILGKLKAHPGGRYDFFKIRKGLDRVSRLYTSQSLLESNLRLRRDQKSGTVDISLKVDPGPRLDFVFEGAAPPGGVQKQLRRVWSSGVFDAQRTDDAAGVLRAWLVRDRYLTPQVQPYISIPAPDRKRVLFEIERGPRFDTVEWAFEGARGIPPKRLREVIESQKLSTEVHTKPARVVDLLTRFYREMGYLDAAIGAPRDELNPETHTARIVLPVNEGPLYRVGTAHFDGNRALNAAELAEAAPLPAGEEFRPELRENSLQRLRETYWARGFNDVEVDAELLRIPERALVDLNFRIVENARGVVAAVTVEGNRRTSDGLIRSQLQLKPGEPVNLQKIGESRRKLYNTGAFAVVEINREDLAPPDAAPGADHPVRLRVKVEEVQPFELRYGAYYDTERGAGGIFDLSSRNLLGGARALGLRGRYDSELHELRLNFSEPLLQRFPIHTVAGTYFRREIYPETDQVSGFNVDRLGFSLQQEASLGRGLLLNYSYKIERSHTYDTGPDPIFDVRLRIASLTSTLTRDTRDDILDASRGSFLSHAVQYSPESLGSQVRFIKYSGQYFRYFPLQRPRVELFTNQVLRPRLVYATGVRVGLGTGLGGQEIPLSERFFAGGSTTIRGFEQNSVGPVTGGIVLPGGNAMLVVNNELRFPLLRILDGVAFVDLGNVYPKVSDFSLTNIRGAAGPGLRLRTPWFLLRLDYGVKLDRRPGESLGRLFFSIGQAF